MIPEVLDGDVANPALVSLQGRKCFRFFTATHFPDPVKVRHPRDAVNILEKIKFPISAKKWKGKTELEYRGVRWSSGLSRALETQKNGV